MRKLLLASAPLAAVAAVLLGGSASAGPPPTLPDDKLDLRSAPPPTIEEMVASSTGGGPTGKGRPPRVGPNVRVNAAQAGFPAGLIGRSETTITAVDGKLVAGWNDAQGFCGPPFGVPCTPQSPPGLSGYGFSMDGGRTWTDGGAPDPFGGVLSRGDPWMANDGGNRFYYANLAVNATNGATLGVGVWRGHFTDTPGFMWDDVKVFDSPENATTPDFDFLDKEALVGGKGPFRKRAYVSLTNFQGFDADDGCPFLPQFGFGQIEVWRTSDGGNTWQGPAIAGPEAADSAADCGFTGTLQQSSAPAIGPNGAVYVVWQFGPTFDASGASSADADIVFTKSLDGGVTFSAPTKVADINSSRANSPIGYNRSRVNDHPRIDVIRSDPFKGRILVTYYSSESPAPSATNPATAQTLVNIHTFVTHSDDGGATWSTPVEVGGPIPSPLPSGVGAIKRWWPDVTVSSAGEVHVVYLEEQATQRTADPSDTECRIAIGGGLFREGKYSSVVETWWTFSTDGGTSFSMPLKLSDATSVWCTPAAAGGNVASNIRPNMGDYIDAEALSGMRITALWADGRNKVADSFFAAGKGG